MNFKLGELFCGPGGLALAAKNATFRRGKEVYQITHEWANDIHEDSCQTYINNICPDNPQSVICKDVRQLDINKLTPIDALVFGFPCNDFSIVGESKGFNGTFGPLYTYGVKVLNKYHPKWFLAENVGGLSSANEGTALNIILRDLANEGYVLTVNLYKFEEYGIPQARHRIIIVGIKESENKYFRVPKPNGQKKTCRVAIENPPIPKGAPNHIFTRQSNQVVERLKYIKPGQNAWNADIPESLKLRVKGARLSNIYKRLDPAEPSYTVTGCGGGGTHVYHWKENRALTNRERARLQTFPDTHVFVGSKESVRRQIGMAVPVKGAQIVFEAILKTFAGIKYDFVDPSFGYLHPSSFNLSSVPEYVQYRLPLTVNL